MIEEEERRDLHRKKTGQILFDAPIDMPERTTSVSIYPHGQKLTVEFLDKLDVPLKNIRLAQDEITKQSYFVGDSITSTAGFGGTI